MVTPAFRRVTPSMATNSAGGLTAQRDSYAEGILNADREHRLQELPGWTWDLHADQWEEGFSRLLDYVDRHGDARVPYAYTVDGYKLGAWVRNQRSRRSTLEAERRCRLRSLSPAGHGTPSPPSGRRASADSWTTSTATVTPASLSPTRSTATSSARGSIRNASTTPMEPLTLTANADFRSFLDGLGRPRRPGTTSNATVTPTFHARPPCAVAILRG